jgi:hypothetical protein
LRKNLTLTNYIWNPQYADPSTADFALEKQTREDQVSPEPIFVDLLRSPGIDS